MSEKCKIWFAPELIVQVDISFLKVSFFTILV